MPYFEVEVTIFDKEVQNYEAGFDTLEEVRNYLNDYRLPHYIVDTALQEPLGFSESNAYAKVRITQRT